MSGDKPFDPDRNPPLSRVLAEGPDYLANPDGKAPIEPPAKPHAIAPKPSITRRPPATSVYDPDSNNGHPFGGGILR